MWQPENIPDELKARRRWLWTVPLPGKNKVQQVPFSAKLRPANTNAADWFDFTETLRDAFTYEGKTVYVRGLSYAMAAEDGLVFIDLDNARNSETGEPEPWAAAIIEALNSYTEISRSGTGYHIIVRAKIPKAAHPAGSKVEMYCDAKPIAMTGNLDPYFCLVSPAIETCDIQWLYNDVVAGKFAPAKPRQEPKQTAAPLADASAEDFRLIGEVARQSNAKTADALETAVLNAHGERFGKRNKEKGPREGKTYLRYSVENFLKKNPPASETTHDTSVPAQFEESVVIRCADEVQELPIEWLWPNRFPLAAVSALTGNPDTGKTTFISDFAARVSTSTDFPDAKMPEGVGGEVLIMAAEDDYARVIKPRLMAAGANTKNIFFIETVEIRQGARREERMFALDTDLGKLEAELESNPLCALIIIDPVSSYFGKGNMNSKQDVRTVFNRLKAIAERFRVAIVVVEHFNKRVDVSAIHKMGGSVALTAAVRAAFMFAKVPDEDGQYVMHFIKGNFAKRKIGRRYTIQGKQVSGLGEVPCISWGAEDVTTADDLLAAEKAVSETGRAARASKFLKEYLTEEKPADDVVAEGKKRNISRDALFEVKKELGIVSSPRGNPKVWYWKPPDSWRPAEGDANAPF